MLKMLLLVLALLNTLLGAALAATAVKQQFPAEAIAIGLAVCFQGAYTLLYSGVLESRHRDRFRVLFIGGHGAAALVGGLGFLSNLLSNLHPRNGDLELAPMAMGFFLFALAVTALIYDGKTESPLITSA